MEKKFDLKPFDKVLVRDDDDDFWEIDMFGRYVEGLSETCHPYSCLAACWNQCIPFEGNEHLLGTTDSYEEPFIPQEGDFVAYDFEVCGRKHKVVMTYKKLGEESAYGYVSYSTHDNRIMLDVNPSNQRICKICDLRPATEEERQLLLAEMHKVGKDWNADERRVVLYVPPYIPKSGDFVVSGWKEDGKECKWVAIVKGEYEENYYQTYYGRYIVKATDVRDSWYDESSDSQQYTRAASVDEIRFALDGLHNDGKDWDDDNEAIVDWEWEPSDGEQYYYCKFDDELNEFDVQLTTWGGLSSDTFRRDNDNCFREWDDCNDRCERLNEAVKSVK